MQYIGLPLMPSQSSFQVNVLSVSETMTLDLLFAAHVWGGDPEGGSVSVALSGLVHLSRGLCGVITCVLYKAVNPAVTRGDSSQVHCLFQCVSTVNVGRCIGRRS